MIILNFCARYDEWNQEIHVADMRDAVSKFRARIHELHAHGGGYIQIAQVNGERPLIEWKEASSGGYVHGQVIDDIHPETSLRACDDVACEANNDHNPDFCEDCEVKCREMCLEYLLTDAALQEYGER